MSNITIILTCITWLLYFSYRTIDAIKGTKGGKLNLKWFKEYWKKIIHIEEILLIAIFVYFTRFGNTGINEIVNKMLFIVMNLYLFINAFYDKRQTDNKFGKSDLPLTILTSLVLIIPIWYYLDKKDMIMTYYILFGLSFFSYPIVLVYRLIEFIIRKIIKK